MNITRRTALATSAAVLATVVASGAGLANATTTATSAGATAPATAVSAASTRPTLRLGSQGSAVRDLQQRLIDHGYPTFATAYFGVMTRDAVKQLQKEHGLTVDGVAGPRTWRVLLGDTDPGPVVTRPTLREGARGDLVRELQRDLNTIGRSGTVRVDGIFTRSTRTAVVRFQREIGIPADGVVGPRTWAMIDGQLSMQP